MTAVVPEPVEGEVLDPPTGHEVETRETPGGLGVATCSCGQWEAIVNSPRSAEWAFAEYRGHLRAVGLG